MKISRWDDKLVDQLKSLYLQHNLTTLEIGKKLGFTKNAIIGKIHRLGLIKDEDNTSLAENSKPKSLKPKPTESLKAKKSVVQNPKNSVKTKKKKGEYTLEELESNMCVWPFGGDDSKNEITFCGDLKVEKSSYCKEHLDIAYLAPKKQVRKTNLETFTEEDIEEEDFPLQDKQSEEEI